jgi:hypothetical protein
MRMGFRRELMNQNFTFRGDTRNDDATYFPDILLVIGCYVAKAK